MYRSQSQSICNALDWWSVWESSLFGIFDGDNIRYGEAQTKHAFIFYYCHVLFIYIFFGTKSATFIFHITKCERVFRPQTVSARLNFLHAYVGSTILRLVKSVIFLRMLKQLSSSFFFPLHS